MSLLRQGTIQGSKSTALTPLILLLGVLLLGLMGSPKAGLPDWIVATLAGSFAVLVVGFVAAYAYFAVKNPDALRTERYTLTKLAIEHRLRGDDVAGITESVNAFEVEPSESQKPLPLPTPEPRPKKPRAGKQDKTGGGQEP
jgi:hypothetical protein